MTAVISTDLCSRAGRYAASLWVQVQTKHTFTDVLLLPGTTGEDSVNVGDRSGAIV